MWRDSAAENGLFAPSPSSATCPGAVANAISVPAPKVAPEPSAAGAANPDPASMARFGPAYPGVIASQRVARIAHNDSRPGENLSPLGR